MRLVLHSSQPFQFLASRLANLSPLCLKSERRVVEDDIPVIISGECPGFRKLPKRFRVRGLPRGWLRLAEVDGLRGCRCDWEQSPFTVADCLLKSCRVFCMYYERLTVLFY
ncbi:hypothetical protein M0R45_010516 [Rubus argutus]|uniref:Uncharacterized protein n=1 Tax=Rubus argutus TaxID=59490 RepID=A0AAW1YAM7_RUBAR